MTLTTEHEKTLETKTRKSASGESGRAKFRRLAPARTKAAIWRLRLVGNLSASMYESTDEERTKIMNALFAAVHDVKRRFEKQSKEDPDTFEL